MSMVCGLDLHRQQITFDALVLESGESWRGRVWQPDRERFRRWLRDDVTPRQPACRALADAQYGIGPLLAVAVWSELGDCRRFSRSRQAVRHTGLDVAVDASDRRRAGGYLSRQGPQTLRWALYEAAKNSSHQRSPDHAYYAPLKDRHGGKIAAIAVARQFTRRCYHILRNLDPDVVYAIPI
jgi:transposase